MSAKVVEGLLGVYALARLRPVCMTLAISTAARLCIPLRKPINKISGNSRLAQLSNQLELGVLASNSTPWLCSSALCASLGKLLGAVVVNFSPLSSSPVMLLVWLLTVTLLTWPASTFDQNALNGCLAEFDVGQTRGRANDSIKTAKSTGMTQRGQPDPQGRRPPRSGGC